MKKLVPVALIFLLLTQSCVVYHNTSISISEAVDKGAVLVTDKDGQSHAYKNIFKKDNVYYGLDEINTSSILIDIVPFRSTLDTAEIYSIQLKDIKKSNKRQYIGAAGFLVATGVLVLLTYYAFENYY